jgi:ATP-dependent Lon protease
MPKRPARNSPKEAPPPVPKKRVDRKRSEDITWVLDTTLQSDDDDSTYNPEDDECGTEYEDMLAELLKVHTVKEKPKKNEIKPAMTLTRKEQIYFNSLPASSKTALNVHMERMKSFGKDADIPMKFQIISLPVSDYVKTTVLKKIAAIEDESGESYKLKNWIEAFLRIPFGKHIPLPVKLDDGREKCSQFMRESRQILDKAVYGMASAKTQIMQTLAQWIVNPVSAGNVIALQGPAGVGKTSIARNGIAQALHRPFEFFSLGGASDISNFVGHSYTYEGSMWGRIAEALMHSKCMNPVLYFDELDKISGTPHGEEIASMLIHLTDRSQNTQFHDRYFSGVDFDVSQCLFVFSFNDITAVNAILRDRMQVINCSGYTAKDKQAILQDYVWPDLLNRLKFIKEDIILTEEAIKFIISDKEPGVRSMIRTAESIITRLNMIRIADEETMKEYKFYTHLVFPVKLDETMIKKLLTDAQAKEDESWKSMYN